MAEEKAIKENKRYLEMDDEKFSTISHNTFKDFQYKRDKFIYYFKGMGDEKLIKDFELFIQTIEELNNIDQLKIMRNAKINEDSMKRTIAKLNEEKTLKDKEESDLTQLKWFWSEDVKEAILEFEFELNCILNELDNDGNRNLGLDYYDLKNLIKKYKKIFGDFEK